MDCLRLLGVAFVIGSVSAGCAPGRDVKSAGKEDKLGFDESGKGKKCDTPSSSCDEVKEPSLDFQEKCREGGFRMKQCGCESLCTGNINGTKTGYNSKNQLKMCSDSGGTCQEQETSAAYQDACDAVGGEMMECNCEWLCSKQLKAAIPDAPKEDEKSADDSGGDKKDDSAKKEEKARPTNMDGKTPAQAAKDKASEKPTSSKKSNDKASSKKSSDSDKSSGEPKRKGRFSDPDE